MRDEELKRLCQEVEAGENRFVQNLQSLYAGKVVACSDAKLTIEAFGHRVVWTAEHCRSVEPTVNPLGPPTSG